MNESGNLSGHSTASLRSRFTFSIPPMSFHFVVGVSTKTSRIAEGLTIFRASSKSFWETLNSLRTSCGISLSSSKLNLWMFLRRTVIAASFARELMSAPTNPWVFLASSSSFTDFVSGIPRVWIFRIESLPSLSGTEISTSRSNLPGRLSAGSIEFGLFVAPMTTTLPRDFRPSIIVSNCETTLRSTSPPVSSRFGARESISSIKIIAGAFFSASSKISRIFFSDSP